MSDAAPRSAHVVIPFLVVTLIWSSTWLVIRDQVSIVPVGWSVCYRFIVAGAAMFALARLRGAALWIGPGGIAFAALLGLLQFAGNFNFVYRAETLLTSGLVAVFYALLIIPNSLLAWVFFRQPVTRGFLIGSMIAVAGVILLFVHEYRFAPIAPGAVIGGLILSLCGMMCASSANIMQGAPIARRLPLVSVLAWAMLLGAVMDGVLAWHLSGPPAFDARPAYIGGILYLALAGSVVTFPLYFRLIQQIGAARAAYSGVLTPVIAMLLSTAFEGYRWSPLAAAGALLALLGMAVALRAKSAAS